MSKGWQTVENTSRKGKNKNKNIKDNDQGSAGTRGRSNNNKNNSNRKVAISLVENDADDFSPAEHQIFALLRSIYPKGLTAVEIAKQLTASSKNETVYTKEEIGNYLYDGDLNNFVEHDGRPPNRKWSVKSAE